MTSQTPIQVGQLQLLVTPGQAANQTVSVSPRWRAALERSSGRAAALPNDLTARLMLLVQDDDGTPKALRRDELYRRAASGPLDEACFVTMAWGLGTTGQWNFLTGLTRQALGGLYQHLQASREAIDDGADLRGLWAAHFARPRTPGFGSVSFGSKWLHAVGWRRTAGEAQPLVYDRNIAAGLRGCAGLAQFPPAKNQPRAGYIAWCEYATDVTTGTPVGPDDLEHALFRHADMCTNDVRCRGRTAVGRPLGRGRRRH